MNVISLKKFGLNLSGRPLGIASLPKILAEHRPPYELDFNGVFSIGSSFADEVVAKLANLNGGSIVVLNSNNIINKCLKDVAQEQGFILEFRE